MAVNYYFQSGVPEAFTANQRLIEDLTVQSIQINGMETYYLPRTLVEGEIDPIFTEDALAKYDNAYRLEMYLDNAMGFEGDGGVLSKFGIQINDSCTFVVARRRWEAEVGRTGSTRLPRPIEGDIVYLPLTKSYFEIKKVEAHNPFYQLGKLFVYRLECELFQFSHERIDTGVTEIDSLSDLFNGAEEAHFIFTESGDQIVNEDGTGILLDYTIDEIDPGAQNEEFNKADGVIDFSEHNPFGELDHA